MDVESSAAIRREERWSRLRHDAWALARAHLLPPANALPNPARATANLRRLLARRYVVAPVLQFENAVLLFPRASLDGLASAMEAAIQSGGGSQLPPALRRLPLGGWTGGVEETRSAASDPHDRARLRETIAELLEAPLTLPAELSGPPGAERLARGVAQQRRESPGGSEDIVSSSELAARARSGAYPPAQQLHTAIPAVPQLAERVLVVCREDVRPLPFETVVGTLFKGLKLLEAFGCGRMWMYSPGGFEVDYAQDLAGTREFAAEGERFYERVAFLGAFDVALLMSEES